MSSFLRRGSNRSNVEFTFVLRMENFLKKQLANANGMSFFLCSPSYAYTSILYNIYIQEGKH